MNTNEIGLVISGCKGGYKTFCHNEFSNFTNPDIKKSVHDLREFIRCRENRLNSFSIQFHHSYKIYTLYRSSHDEGSGAFVAITLFVPHAIRIKNVRDVLMKLMDTYFKEYINPMSLSHIPGTYHDIKPFMNLLSSMAEVEKEPRRQSAYISDALPKFRVYEQDSELDTYFLSPYRKEFFEGKEIFFLSSDIYSRIDELMRFEQPIKRIETVSEPEPLPELRIDPKYWSSIKSLKIGGQEVSPESSTPVCDYDEVEIIFYQQYFKDYTFKSTVDKLKSNKYIRTSGRIYTLTNLNIALEPITYTFKVMLDGKPVPDKTIFISIKNLSPAYVKDSTITLKGDEVTKLCRWGLYVNDNLQSTVLSNKPIDFRQLINENNTTVDLESVEQCFKVRNEERITSDLKISASYTLEFLITGKQEQKISFRIPADLAKEQVSFSCKGAICKLSGNEITLEAKPVEYRLVFPDKLSKDCNWYVEFDGNQKRPSANGTISIKDSQLKKMKLFIGRKDDIECSEVEYSIEGTRLYPKGYLVVALGSESVMTNIGSRPNIVDTWRIFQKKPDINPDIYDIKKSDSYGLNILNVTSKRSKYMPGGGESTKFGSGYTDWNNDGNSTFKHEWVYIGSRDSYAEDNHKFTVCFNNCVGAKIDGETITQEGQKITINKNSTLFLKKKECTILINPEEYKKGGRVDNLNIEQGFKVTYYPLNNHNSLNCSVTYEGKNLRISRKLVLLCASAMIVLALGICVWLFFPWSKPAAAVLGEFQTNLQQYDISELNNFRTEVKNSGSTPDSLVIICGDGSEKAISILFDEKVFKEKFHEDIDKYVDALGDTEVVFTWETTFGVYSETHSLKELLSIAQKSELKYNLEDFIKSKKTLNMVISFTPDALSKIVELNSRVKDKNGKETDKSVKDTISLNGLKPIGEDFPVLSSYLVNLAWSKVNTNEIESLKEYIDLKAPEIKSETHQNEAEELLKELTDKQAAVAMIEKEEKNHINALQKDNCTKNTVTRAENWYNSLGVDKQYAKKIKNKINAYNKFFNAKTNQDIANLIHDQKNYINEFSANQKEIILEYGKGTNNFNKLYGGCNGMNFNARKLGLM